MQTYHYPTLTQTSGHPHTSEKYALIPTARVLGVLDKHGWLIRDVREARASAAHQGFQKHLVRLFHPDLVHGDEFTEIVLYNSHMGNSAFRLLSGIFRTICANGLVTGDTYTEHRIRHIGYTDAAVETAVHDLIDATPRIHHEVARFKSLMLNTEQAEAYSRAAMALRFDGETYLMDPRAFLRRRRPGDRSTDLWTTFNVVQEHLLRGGMRQLTKDGKRLRARRITSLDEDIRLNRALWTLTADLAARV